MRRVLYPGSFDPVTNGHLDLIRRAGRLFDEVYVAVAVNNDKNALFSADERMAMLRESCHAFSNVNIVSFQGLLVDAINNYDANAVLRGLRAFSDFEYELQMALMNRKLSEDCETIFMMPSADNSFISSRLIKEIAAFNGDFTGFVPSVVVDKLKDAIKNRA
ncbi:MAG: pantetheine-phosphate adenylyltransferase [Victivallaceae bacterium]|nr:pantetheine-phosphate adenylyltransferase [Victivallaceae bacterium]